MCAKRRATPRKEEGDKGCEEVGEIEWRGIITCSIQYNKVLEVFGHVFVSIMLLFQIKHYLVQNFVNTAVIFPALKEGQKSGSPHTSPPSSPRLKIK